jgi:hypothetical protein
MALFSWQKKKAEDGTETFELPDDLAKDIKKGAEASEKLSKIEQMLADQKSVQEAKDAKEKKERDDAAAAAAKKKQEEVNGTIEEQIEALMLEGRTKEAVELALKNKTDALTSVVMTTRADQIKRELFENADKFKYYAGDLKTEVDSLLEKQPLAFRQDPANIENVYNTIVGKHHGEIMEGKIKTRFAGGTGTSHGSSGTGDNLDDKKELVITDDIRKASKTFGMKPEEYAALLDKEGVGYV